MADHFQTWSESNPGIRQKLKPDLGLREWKQIPTDEKRKIWLHFKNKNWFNPSRYTCFAIFSLNEIYKHQSFAKNILEHGGPHIEHNTHPVYQKYIKECCLNTTYDDFRALFMNADQDILFELISLYAKLLRSDVLLEKDGFVEGLTEVAEEEAAIELFRKFKQEFNDIFEQFNINILLSESGLIFRQEKEIMEEIYEPVLSFLADPKWEKVNQEFEDAFSSYQKKTAHGYSTAITSAVSALQAFLQIKVYGKTGKGQISELIQIAKSKKLIPDDPFSSKIFMNLESALMSERQAKSISHPKKEYGTEKHSRLVFNLIMIFIQHAISP